MEAGQLSSHDSFVLSKHLPSLYLYCLLMSPEPTLEVVRIGKPKRQDSGRATARPKHLIVLDALWSFLPTTLMWSHPVFFFKTNR